MKRLLLPLLVLCFPILAVGQMTYSDYFITSEDYALRELATEIDGKTDTLLGQVVDSILLGRDDGALVLLDRIADSHEDQPLVPLFKGIVMMDKDRPAEVIAHMDRAIALDSRLMLAYLLKGVMQVDIADWDAAYATFLRTSELFPASPEPHFYLGVWELGQDHYVKARKHWEVSLELDACHVPARIAVLYQRVLAGRQWKGIKEIQDLLNCENISPEVYRLLALTASWSGDREMALEHMTSALQLSPTNAEFLFYRSDLYRETEQYELAFNDLYYGYSAVSADRQGDGVGDMELTNSRKEMEYAMNYFRFLGRFAPELSPLYCRYLLAIEHRDGSERMKAERELRNAGQENHPGFEYFRILADLRLPGSETFDYERIDRVLALDPNVIDLYRIRGEEQLLREAYREAYESFHHMGKLEKNNIPSLKGMSAALDALQQEKAAVNMYSLILSIDSTDLFALAALGDYHFRKGEYGRATDYYERYVEWIPHHGMVRYQLALCAYYSGDPEKTLEHIRQSPKMYVRTSPSCLNLRGLARTDLDSLGEANNDFAAAIMEDPDFIDAYVNRARLNIKLGKHDSALRELDYIIQRAPENAYAYVLRATVKKDLGLSGVCADVTQARNLGMSLAGAFTEWCSPGEHTATAGGQ